MSHIAFGTHTLSGLQKEMLKQALVTDDAALATTLLSQVISDEDITSGKEQIDPRWTQVFRRFSDQIRRYIPLRQFKQIADIFGQASVIDDLIRDLKPDKLRIAFLLGAGCSKPAPSDIPTVKELLPDLLERARRLDRDDLTRLADFCSEEKIVNIEDLLTAAQLGTFCSRNPTVLRLVDFLLKRTGREEETASRRRLMYADLSSVAFLQETLQGLFGLLTSRMLPAKPNRGHLSIAGYAKHHPASAIVTTNYDCCMDLALGQEAIGLTYQFDFGRRTSKRGKTAHATRLIKLHGSLNWFYCETCQEIELISVKKMVEYFVSGNAPYPVIATCHNCGGQRRPLLVPPLAMKFDVSQPLDSLLRDAKAAFAEAELIVVVGFSFADADIYVSRMISKSMQTSKTQRVLIVDPDDAVADKVRRKFKASIPKFDESRILKMGGDCAVTLPAFLEGKMMGKSGKAVLEKLNMPHWTSRPKIDMRGDVLVRDLGLHRTR